MHRANKRLGTHREFHYLNKLKEINHWAMRAPLSAGSGISKQEFINEFPEIWERLGKVIRPIDIISVDHGVLIFHQISKRKSDISQDEIDVLRYEAKKANAWPILAWKEGRKWVTVIAENKGNKNENKIYEVNSQD